MEIKNSPLYEVPRVITHTEEEILIELGPAYTGGGDDGRGGTCDVN